MEWNMEENFSMEWNMEWKILGMEWKWNGRKFAVWNMEKPSSIPFHAMPWLALPCRYDNQKLITLKPIKQDFKSLTLYKLSRTHLTVH